MNHSNDSKEVLLAKIQNVSNINIGNILTICSLLAVMCTLILTGMYSNINSVIDQRNDIVETQLHKKDLDDKQVQELIDEINESNESIDDGLIDSSNFIKDSAEYITEAIIFSTLVISIYKNRRLKSLYRSLNEFDKIN